MPCTDGCNARAEPKKRKPTREQVLNKKTPAMMCAIIKAIPFKWFDIVMAYVDWQEAGVTREQFDEWWKLHRKRDARRLKAKMRRVKGE